MEPSGKTNQKYQPVYARFHFLAAHFFQPHVGHWLEGSQQHENRKNEQH